MTLTYNPRTDTVRLNGEVLQLRPQLKTLLRLLWPTGRTTQADLIEALWPDLGTADHIWVLVCWLNEMIEEGGWRITCSGPSGVRVLTCQRLT